MTDGQLNFVDFDAQVSTKDLSRESASFLWLALLKDILIQLPRYEHRIANEHDEASAKREMVMQLRLSHADNPVQLKKIDEFEEFYDCKEMAVYLYLKQRCPWRRCRAAAAVAVAAVYFLLPSRPGAADFQPRWTSLEDTHE
jgi:hypothetical protein